MNAGSWQHAKELLADLLTRPAGERSAYLSANCSDPELRAELERLLEESDSLDPFGLLSTTGDASLAAGPSPGTRIGPYIVLERLGGGGMGEVYLGSDTRLERRVALKCLTASGALPALKSALIREARAAAQITHPNVAIVHDVVDDGTRAYLVMEYVEGESLASRLRGERPSIPAVVAIGRQLAAALAAAHARGVIHRDLKPANIQMTARGGVKVVDFGIAHTLALFSTASAITTASAPPALVGQPGTPPYMAPERLLGHAGDERSDVFSLGVVLYEMATGRRPYPVTEPSALVAAMAEGAPPNPRDLNPLVPRALGDTIVRTLDPEPERRFQTATEVDEALARIEKSLTGAAPSTKRLLARAVISVAISLVVVMVLGLINSTSFNLTFGREGAFGAEPFGERFIYGVRSLVAPAAYIGLVLVGVSLLMFVGRLLGLVPAFARVAARSRRLMRVVADRVDVSDPRVSAQVLAAVGMVGLAGVAWRFRGIIGAWSTFINYAGAAELLPLRPSNAFEQVQYGWALDLIVLMLACGLYRVARLRRESGRSFGAAGVAACIALLAIAVLMYEWPYRVMWQNRFERVDYAEQTCYAIGEGGGEELLYCPATAVPHNRIVSAGDPALHRTGVVESVFSWLDSPAR